MVIHRALSQLADHNQNYKTTVKNMEAALKPLSDTKPLDELRADGSRIGEKLRKVREERGFNLADVARDTRIPLRHLTALEADQYDKLPARPYAIGFIRTYCTYLGISPNEVVDQYKTITYSLEAANPGVAPEPFDESRLPSRGLVIGSLVGLVSFIGLAWFAYSHFRQDKETPVVAAAPSGDRAASTSAVVAQQAPPVLSQSSAPPVSATPAPAVAAPAIATPEAPAPAALPATAAAPATGASATGGLVIRALEDSWIKVSDGGPVSLKIGILKAGDTYSVPSVAGVKLTTGNAGGLTLEYNGKPLASFGKKGELIKNMPLDPATLAARPTQ